MKVRRRKLAKYAEENYPLLFEWSYYLAEPWQELYGTIEAAIDKSVRDYNLHKKKALLLEWRDWNNEISPYDQVIEFLQGGFNIDVVLKTDADARELMNLVYDKMITSVRQETQSKWKPW